MSQYTKNFVRKKKAFRTQLTRKTLKPKEEPVSYISTPEHRNIIPTGEPFVPEWLPQYEKFHFPNSPYNLKKNKYLMAYLTKSDLTKLSFNDLPPLIKSGFGNNPTYYKNYLSSLELK